MDRKPLASINITALVDVLLVLLVIMMLALPMYVNRLPVVLPETSLAGAPVLANALPVALKTDGTLLMNASPTDLATVLRHITSEVSVEVAADADVRYEDLAQLVAHIQSRGPKEIMLLTR